MKIQQGDLLSRLRIGERLVPLKDFRAQLEASTPAKLTVCIARKGADGEVYFDLSLIKAPRFKDLGVEFRNTEQGLVVKDVLPDGPVAKWNDAGAEPALSVGDLVVAVNDCAGSCQEMLAVIQGAKRTVELTCRKPRRPESAHLKEIPTWSLDLSCAPKVVELLEHHEQDLLAANTIYTERPDDFDVNGRETYWDRKGKHYVYYNSLSEWCVGKSEHFEVNRDSPHGGRRFALATGGSRDELATPELSQNWQQWDTLLGQWTSPCPEAGVAAVGATGKEELWPVQVKLATGRDLSVRVPCTACMNDVAAEVHKGLRVERGKVLRFRQHGVQFEMQEPVRRIDRAIPLEAGVFTDLSKVDCGSSAAQAAGHSWDRLAEIPTEWLKIPVSAIFVDSTHMTR